jgi:prepilin-type N-terminal cleavage/methylation domain-containing protein
MPRNGHGQRLDCHNLTSEEPQDIASMRKAFTLIELLVVIAIIAILAAILFPVFAQAKAAAKKTQALSNGKQMMLGYLLYIGDTDGVYYEAAQGMSQGTQGPTSLIWNGYIYPYTKNVQIANDPAATNPVSSFGGFNFTGMYYTPVDYKQLALGMNWNFTSQLDYACSQDFSPPFPDCTTFFSENQFAFPAQTLVFASSAQRTPDSVTGAGFWVSPIHNINADNGISDRHNTFSIVSFMDGHAKALKSTTLLVSDQVVEINPNASGQCVNYDVAQVYWDPSAPMPSDFPLCEGHGLR